ncbi:MAG: Fur family transcriptional regulator [Bdellovibrionota bacterium]
MASDKNHRHQHQTKSLDQALSDLKLRGLKVTIPRRAILQALILEHGPFTAEEIHKQISRRVCDLATVYRTLSSLEEAGLLRRCEFGDGSARYEMAGQGNAHHHHLICKSCKKVEVVDECELEEIDRFAQKRGFTDISHTLEFFGICADCRK